MTEFDDPMQSYFTIACKELVAQDRNVAEWRLGPEHPVYKFILADDLFFMYNPREQMPDQRWTIHTYNNLPMLVEGEYTLPEWTPYGKTIHISGPTKDYGSSTDSWRRLEPMTLAWSNDGGEFNFIFKVNNDLALGWQTGSDDFAGNFIEIQDELLRNHIDHVRRNSYWVRMGWDEVLV
ncbi:hypothetical protein HOT82_gp053 [Gordonia phage Ronaldo]|uniref:Uncharacterized protein n=3 Tax=Ronaldovirus ronaldo TaxID=2734270 RepID=A0A6B9LEH8_9CAUD|nr:hypothetical protein HOT82_gp053 [Gordonia phage Ronaldo]AXN53615.1 hypothetical protein SEA_RONALDO_53 [Gordonia phage Ronaldo]QDH48392.1 hypothetical protein SEA_ZIKO_53 [Gordonia phage Ziko]QHB38168.1 hypothetical protein SEA_VOLT_52 [Gordonia phage Volt]